MASHSPSIGNAVYSASKGAINTVSSTIIIGLKNILDVGMIKPGMQLMVAGFGVGLSWRGTMLKF